ncbi:MAG: permease prefix domain 1-containing protein [Lachnospiraceae bacterium]|nr:permease prefix domain 1-containing protein [Lachnospiraceae bacterium]
MEAIRNYLDQMFANLPGTPSVLRAKEELWQMMEDKYTELINEGKSENEAVGSVISEFGNLSELAEALGLEEEIKEQMETEVKNPGRILSVEDAEGYIRMRREQAFPISLGIALCIFSVIPAILISNFFNIPDIFAAVGMFFFAMIGVGFIIYGNHKKRKWNFLREENCTLSMEATKYVTAEEERFDGVYVAEMVIGVIFCACSWLPAALIDELLPVSDEFGGLFFFLFIGIGVFLLRHSSICKKGYKKLLKLNKKGTMKANYKAEQDSADGSLGVQPERTGESAAEPPKYISPLAEFFMDVYWPSVVCLYICASFITSLWGATWVIWPVAGILHGVFRKNLTE